MGMGVGSRSPAIGSVSNPWPSRPGTLRTVAPSTPTTFSTPHERRVPSRDTRSECIAPAASVCRDSSSRIRSRIAESTHWREPNAAAGSDADEEHEGEASLWLGESGLGEGGGESESEEDEASNVGLPPAERQREWQEAARRDGSESKERAGGTEGEQVQLQLQRQLAPPEGSR
eukprot:scaffold86255_cov31-Tisochrysis_lutea.AAC.1